MSRRDIVLPHLWQNPELYRGVPIHLLGTALRVLRYPSKLSKTGWIYEASIITPDAHEKPLCHACSKKPPRGSRSAPTSPSAWSSTVTSSRSGSTRRLTCRAARRSWSAGSAGNLASQPAPTGKTRLLRWSLIAIAVMFVVSLGRWAYQLYRLFTAPPVSPLLAARSPADEIDTATLEDWANAQGPRRRLDRRWG